MAPSGPVLPALRADGGAAAGVSRLIVAAYALLFLITIHKLEYFLNAKIIGTQINARSWELLGAMLLMESLFGIPGVIAAPVFYAYVKTELTGAGLV